MYMYMCMRTHVYYILSIYIYMYIPVPATIVPTIVALPRGVTGTCIYSSMRTHI